jgi:hypothetical protein
LQLQNQQNRTEQSSHRPNVKTSYSLPVQN